MARIEGTNGADNRDGTGSADTFEMKNGDDVAHGLGGDDVIHGGAGNDKLFGDGGADTVFGDTGQDELRGGAGWDVLVGSHGSDQLYGGDGGDQFWFQSIAIDDNGAINTIMDFNRAQGDKIDIGAIDANVNVAGNQQFHYVANFTGHAGEVTSFFFDATPGTPGGQMTLIELDVDGDRESDLTIGMSGGYSLGTGDFFL